MPRQQLENRLDWSLREMELQYGMTVENGLAVDRDHAHDEALQWCLPYPHL